MSRCDTSFLRPYISFPPPSETYLDAAKALAAACLFFLEVAGSSASASSSTASSLEPRSHSEHCQPYSFDFLGMRVSGGDRQPRW